MRRIEDFGLLEQVFILVGVGPLRSPKRKRILTHFPGLHFPMQSSRAWRARPTAPAKGAGYVPSSSSRRSAFCPAVSGVHVMAYRQEESVPENHRSHAFSCAVVSPPPMPQRNPGPAGLMTDTIISSATREVVIRFERPFVS